MNEFKSSPFHGQFNLDKIQSLCGHLGCEKSSVANALLCPRCQDLLNQVSNINSVELAQFHPESNQLFWLTCLILATDFDSNFYELLDRDGDLDFKFKLGFVASFISAISNKSDEKFWRLMRESSKAMGMYWRHDEDSIISDEAYEIAIRIACALGLLPAERRILDVIFSDLNDLGELPLDELYEANAFDRFWESFAQFINLEKPSDLVLVDFHKQARQANV